MMFRSLYHSVLAVAFLVPLASAQLPTGPQLLVDAGWLNQHLHDPDLVILAVGPRGGYPKDHIAGSQFIRLDDVSAPSPWPRAPGILGLEMAPVEALRATFEKFGISNASRIVVVADSEWDSPATRVVLTLGYVGLGDRTFLLDGGMTAWHAAGYPVTADLPTVMPGLLTTAPVPSFIVDAAYMTAHRSVPHVSLIDARDSEFYAKPAAEQRSAGHIPGARSIPFGSLIEDSSNLYLPPAELQARFLAAGVQPGDTVVAYCHVGQQATVVLFAARLLGHPVKLYDGSFEDWSAHKLPTEGGP